MDCLCIIGPTACGKTSLAVSLAHRLGGEILSADSRQVYKGMDIGTGKDLAEYGTIPYHLIDLVDAGYKYNIYQYQRDFHKALEEVRQRGNLPIMCGGSGLYIEAVCKGYQLPEVGENPVWRAEWEKESTESLIFKLEAMGPLHNSTDTSSRQRLIRALEIARYQKEHEAQYRIYPPLDHLLVGLDPGREVRRQRITKRLKARLQEGLVEEVAGLLEQGVAEETLLYYGLEYRFITLYLKGKMSYEQCVEGLEIAIHQFAKRQMTWLRGMERRGMTIHWLSGLLPLEEQVEEVCRMWAESEAGRRAGRKADAGRESSQDLSGTKEIN